jgi:hypothetical protein
MELFSYILSQFVHCWCIKKLLIFVTWFCILLHCWSCLWCLGVLGWSVFGSLRYRVICKQDTLTISLPICIAFISSSSLISLARNSRMILNRSGESGHLCLLPDFRGNGFSYSPLSMMLAIALSYIDFIMLRYIPFIPSFIRAFIMKLCWILSKALSASFEMIKWFLSCFC